MGLKQQVPRRSVFWPRSWRIIPTRYPEENLYKDVADAKDVEAVRHVERWTNQRLSLEAGDAPALRAGDRCPKGPGAYNITAAFAHLSPSRFSDGTYPVYYAAHDLATAVRETCYHREQFMKATREKPCIFPMRVLVAQIRGSFHDLRGQKRRFPKVYSSTQYQAAQLLGQELWREDSNGIVYTSVRHSKGQCIAVFSPQRISHCRQERYLQYHWDGHKISHVDEIRELPFS